MASGQLAFYGMGGTVRSHPATPCLGDNAYRDFDFWLGTWELTAPAGGQVLGSNRITSELDGCVVEEDFIGSRGAQGRSMSVYDAATDEWSQYFFDQFGSHIRLFGGVENGVMDLRGDRLFFGSSGTITLVDRIRWTPAADGTVNQFWDISLDQGVTFPIVAFNSTYTLDPSLTPAPPLDRQFCVTPEFRQLDFMAGTWAVESKNGKPLGSSVVAVDLEGCMLEEDFATPKGYASQSFFGWDFTDGNWYRIMTDTEGVRLLMSGGLEGDAMVLEGSRPTNGGKTLDIRVTISPDGENRVTQTWSTSKDGGAWKDRATVIFTR